MSIKGEYDGYVARKRGILRRSVPVAVLLFAGGFAVAIWWTAPLLRTGTGSVSKAVCDGVFVSGLDPAQVYREEQLPNPGISKLDWALRYTVDREHR